ncbi:hypothetical protein F4553_006120 [Allocatelliglobosispora scoriae]|uniref:GerMN domain-containing protein n=1 Tax=Allocatelliglobosispora scoriae TaxID=643052 RepID=A0A841BYP2_9ACTN|nr:GerMN domain-containing protein [Allocatelliglobosispora scoriae]MBB5872686.1 hypothetical protein [Allocatelliglobosispora scoriae]
MTPSPGWSEPDEPTEELLRRALRTRAAGADVDPDALSIIRARTRHRSWWHRIRGGAMPFAFTTGSAAAVAATVTAVVVGVGSCAPPTVPDPTLAPGGTSAPATAEPTPSGSPRPASPSAAATTANVPIYYLHDVATKPLLYREFHRLPAGDGSKAAKTKAAITAMLDGRTAYDPDYYSSWPASAAVRSVRVDGNTVTVDLSGAAVNAYDPPSEKAALQQLIWTATAASDADGMKLLLDGKAVGKLWNLLPVSGTLRRGPAVDVLGPVWVIDPQQGAVLSAGPVTVNVAAIVWEATMRVRIRNSADAIVFDKSVLVNAGPPSQGTATVRTQALPAGTYTVEGFYFSARDGSIQAMENHTFTIR